MTTVLQWRARVRLLPVDFSVPFACAWKKGSTKRAEVDVSLLMLRITCHKFDQSQSSQRSRVIRCCVLQVCRRAACFFFFFFFFC